MSWPALVLWSIALLLALVLARPARRTGHGLLALAPPTALAGLGLWLAYLVVAGSTVIAWIALGLAAAGLAVALAALLPSDRGRITAVDVAVWGGAGTLAVTFAFTGVLCFFAGLGYQSPG